jgi:multiple sugar transport system substrate-binding protein
MRRVTVALAVLAVLAVFAFALLAGCGGNSTQSSTTAGPASTGPVHLTIWVGWSARELGVFKGVVAGYEKLHPNVTVTVRGSVNDDQIIAAIRGGKAPDVVSSFTSSNVGAFTTSGAWINLGPFLQKDNISTTTFTPATMYYTQYKGTRTALPLLADTWGLYFNKAMFAKAGIASPPKTISELVADAKKLTVRNPDGSLKVVGFDPFSGFYDGTPPMIVTYAHYFGAKYTDAQGHSILSKDPGWSALFTWQKDLIDWYGYDNLVRWQAAQGDQFSSSNAFEVGKMAMMLDGEWRTAFIAAEHPNLQYGTAPGPVIDTHPELYGSGYVNGTIVGIPKGSPNVNAAWDLVKYLTTDTSALAQFSNGIRNVPSTLASLKSPELKPDTHFQPFYGIFGNPSSTTSPITAVGAAYQTLIQSFAVKNQAGKVPDLQAGLQDLDKQIDAQLAQAQLGAGAP